MKYQSEYKELHSKGAFSGYSVLAYTEDIRLLVKNTSSRTILDYGSGKGHQYSKKKTDVYWGAVVDCYDPGYEPLNSLPNKTYDGVICTEVMEHIPEEEIDDAMRNIFDRADKFVFFSIALRPASKRFANGQNVHVTLKTPMWWDDKIDEHNTKDVLVSVVYS